MLLDQTKKLPNLIWLCFTTRRLNIHAWSDRRMAIDVMASDDVIELEPEPLDQVGEISERNIVH